MEREKRRILPLIALGIAGVVVLVGVGAAVWQRDNIQAVLMSRRHTTDDLKQMLDDNELKTEKILEKLPEVSVRPPTEEEKEKLRSGELTQDDISDMLLVPVAPNGGSLSQPAAAANPESGTEGEAVPATDEKQEQIARLIAQIYGLRETMSGKLDGILGSAKAEYAALPEEERIDAKKQEIGMRCLNEALALEGSCDAQINGILSELDSLLKDTGGDQSVVTEIRRAYKDEKALKKSYYLNLYS
jgi:hypothetical protein